jgi:hypothetical protein
VLECRERAWEALSKRLAKSVHTSALSGVPSS